jgi:hypothetical protein
MQEKNIEPPQFQINADQKTLVGSYANLMRVAHTKDEFVLEFANVHPPVGELVAKIITTPGHMKRTLAALQENVARYESAFGKIEEAKSPGEGEIGFKG